MVKDFTTWPSFSSISTVEVTLIETSAVADRAAGLHFMALSVFSEVPVKVFIAS